MELKTIKDFVMNPDELKKDLIMPWIKALKQNRQEWTTKTPISNPKINRLAEYEENGVIDILKEMFNIEDEIIMEGEINES